jgi:hypothetical protein
MNDDPSKDL